MSSCSVIFPILYLLPLRSTPILPPPQIIQHHSRPPLLWLIPLPFIPLCPTRLVSRSRWLLLSPRRRHLQMPTLLSLLRYVLLPPLPHLTNILTSPPSPLFLLTPLVQQPALKITFTNLRKFLISTLPSPTPPPSNPPLTLRLRNLLIGIGL